MEQKSAATNLPFHERQNILSSLSARNHFLCSLSPTALTPSALNSLP